MHVPGHLAVALLQNRIVFNGQADTLKPILVASLFPDLSDKTIGYILRLMPNGRHYGHNLFALVLTSLLVYVIFGRTTAQAWFVGYVGHLLADLNGAVPWTFPLQPHEFEPGRLRLYLPVLLREGVFLALVIVLYRVWGRSGG